MTTPLSETAFRDAVGSLVDTARQLAAATRTLDTVRALHQRTPAVGGEGWSCTAGCTDTVWPCATARAVNPSLTPKGPKP